jgi:hypothetical protein
MRMLTASGIVSSDAGPACSGPDVGACEVDDGAASPGGTERFRGASCADDGTAAIAPTNAAAAMVAASAVHRRDFVGNTIHGISSEAPR